MPVALDDEMVRGRSSRLLRLLLVGHGIGPYTFEYGFSRVEPAQPVRVYQIPGLARLPVPPRALPQEPTISALGRFLVLVPLAQPPEPEARSH